MMERSPALKVKLRKREREEEGEREREGKKVLLGRSGKEKCSCRRNLAICQNQ